jgi:hypothetical protein
MAPLKATFDEKARWCIEVAKAIARSEGERRLDAVHLIRAGILEYPKDTLGCFREVGFPWSTSVIDEAKPRAAIAEEGGPMPVSPAVAAVVDRLASAGHPVTLRGLVCDFFRHPSVRTKAFLRRLGGTARGGLRRRASCGAPPYRSRREWLDDLHQLWRVRRAAARACGLRVGFLVDDPGNKAYAREIPLDAVVSAEAAIARRGEVSPRVSDPLEVLQGDLSPLERHICEGLLVASIYRLDAHALYQPSVRDLAQMLAPETYPGNCRKVVHAVEGLVNSGIVTSPDGDVPLGLTDTVGLAASVLDQILADLEQDAISRGEASAMKRRLRLVGGWNDDALQAE